MPGCAVLALLVFCCVSGPVAEAAETGDTAPGSAWREKTLAWFRDNWFGHAPGKPTDIVFGERHVEFAGGKIRINIDLALPERASADAPVPVFVFGDHFNPLTSASGLAHYPGIPTNTITARGYAYVTFNVNDLAMNGYGKCLPASNKVHRCYASECPDGAKGTLAAWAWGFSRVMDWIETRPELDAGRVAIVGHSRGGKTALWAGAQDTRIAMTVSNDSGSGGARLMKMQLKGAEPISAFSRSVKHWFADTFHSYAGREAELPYDADDLMKLVAPRLLYVASAADDEWAGPPGEFESARRASAAWEAVGLRGLTLKAYPPPDTRDHDGSVGYHVRSGRHKLLPLDWDAFLDFADRHLKKRPIDRGGVTFDFAAASAKNFSNAQKEKWPVAVRCVVPDVTDGVFQIGEGQCGYLWFEMRNEDKTKYDVSKFECRLTLPDGIRLEGERARGLKAPIHIFNSHDPNGYLVRAVRGKGVAGDATFACYYEGRQVSRIDKVRIVVVDAVKGLRPKRFMTGIHCGARIAELPTGEGVAAFADMVADAGATWMILECSPRVRDIMHSRKLKVTPYDNNWFVNGFMVGNRKRPDEDKYVPLPLAEQPPDGVTRYFLRSASCPIAIYTESPFFRTNTVPLLKSACAGYDGFWANWEPYFFADRGCFCERCKAAFAEYGGFDVKEFGEGWHKLVRDRKSKYRIPWLEFRAREHGRVVKTIDKYVRRFTPPDSFGFVPAVAWIEMGSWYPPIQNAYASYVKQVRQVDFAGDLRWINPWGPYVAWRTNRPYKYGKRFPMAHFFAARDVREQVAKDYPEGRRPKLLSFPLGTLNRMVSQPEWIGMGIDSFFFNRWEASIVYYMPKGSMDARYWRALADSSTRAAKYEDDVIDGRDVSASVSVKPVPEFAVPCRQVSGYISDSTKNKSPLQQVSYEHGARRIVAVFNFWEKGEAFFDLQVKGLKGEFNIVDEKGVAWVPADGRTVWSAAELAAGVRLEIGASRTRVFEIRPADAGLKDATAIRTSAETAARYSARRSALAEEARRDAEEEAALPLPKPDNGNVI